MGEAMNGDEMFLCYTVTGERRLSEAAEADPHCDEADFHVHGKATADAVVKTLKALGFKVRVVRIAKTVLVDELDQVVPGAGDAGDGATPP